MSRRFFSAGLNRISTKSHIATSQSRAERSQKKSERFEQHCLAIRQRRAAQHKRYLNAFKRAGSAFRLWWLMLLGVMQNVMRPIGKLQSSAIQRAPASRRRRVAPHAAGAVEHLESRQLLTAGAVDLSYGNNGVMQVPMGAFDDDAFAVSLQGDGKAVVAGPVYTAGGVEFGVTRFNSDGTLDVSFGDEGKVRTQFGTSSSTPFSVVVQADGRIVVGGMAFNGSNFDFALARYMPNGDLDLSFGAFGRTVRAIGTGHDYGQRLALQADGKILLGGDSFSGDYEDFAIARFETDGTLDTSFGTNGVFKRGLGSQRDSLRGLAVQPDGKIVATGYVFTNTNVLPALLRLNTNGTLDPTLNGDGFTVHSFGGSISVYSGNVSVLPDGRIIAAGVAFNGSRNTFSAIRYNANGSLDSSLDGDGLLSSSVRSNSDSASQIIVRPDGKFYLGGNSYSSIDQDFAVARYNPNGTLDSTFGTNGVTTLAIGTGDDLMNAMAVQSDGNLLLAGSVQKAGNTDFTIARIIGTSAPNDLMLTPDVIPENSPFGTTIGNFTSTDADGTDTFTYSLVTGIGATDNARFYVSGNQLKVSTELDFELKPSYSIRVRTTDQNGKFFEKAFTVSVSNINEAPVVAGLDVSTYNGVAELIQFSAVDPEGNAFTWSIIEPPQHGSLTGSGSSRTYTPDPGYVGADEFVIAANDGTSSSNQAVVRITNSSTARPTVTLSSSTATISEAGPSFMLTAQIDVVQGSSVIIPVSYSGTATAGRDFNAVTEIVIPAGQTTASVPIFVTNDLAYETPGESVVVSIPAGQGYELGTTVSQTISITDDDPLPSVSFRSKSIETAEQSRTIDLSVVLNAESQSPVTVPLVWSGSAVRGVDFDGPNEITIPAGSRVGTVQIQIHDDAQNESAESILVSMGTPTGAIASTTASDVTSMRVLITANDAPIVSLVSASLRVQESVGQVIVEAKLASPATATLTVPFTVTGTGTVGVDFTPASGTFVFGAGKTTASAIITVLDDTAIEQSETVIVTLDNSAAFQKGSIGSTTLDIRDNDTVKVNFQSQVTSVWENQGPASIRATISASSTELRTIPLLLWEPKVPIEGYASLGSDFQAFPLQLVFQPGSTVSDPLLIPFINDSVNETFEQITIAMTAIPGVELGSTAQTVIVIKDNDPLVRLSGPGSGGEATPVRTFTAVLDHATNVDVVLPITISGTAQRGSDYTGPTGNSIIIPAGSTTGSVTFNVIDDTVFEDDETLTVRINNPLNGAATLIEPTVSTSTIFNNDGAPRVFLTPGDYFVHKDQKYFYKKLSERGGTRRLVLHREGATTKDTRVFIHTTGLKFRLEGRDYDGWVTIPANQTSVTLIVRALDNGDYSGSTDISFAVRDVQNAIAPDSKPVWFRIIDDESKTKQKYGADVAMPVGALSIPIFIPEETLDETPVQPLSGDYEVLFVRSSAVEAANPFTLSIPIAITTKSATASSGLLDESTVFLDSNGNGVLDFVDLNADGIQQSDEPDEVSATTALDGSFAIFIPSEYDRNSDGLVNETEARYVVSGGIDEAIGLPLTTSLKAPMGASVVTPLTTLAESMIRTAGLSLAGAVGRVAESTGAPNYNFATRASVYDVLQGNLDAVTVYREILKLQGTVVGLGELLFGAAGDQQSLELLTDVVYEDIAAKLSLPGAILDYSQPSVIEAILRGAVFRSGVTLPETSITGSATIIATSNSAYDALAFSSYTNGEAFLHDMLKIKKVMLGGAATALREVGEGTLPIATAVTSFTGISLTSRIQAALVAANATPPGMGVEGGTVREGDNGTKVISFKVHLEGAHAGPVTVNYNTVDDTAIASEGDYVAASGILTWAAGDNSVRTIDVVVNGDTVIEADEAFRFYLSNVEGAVVRFEEAFGLISNDEQFTVTADPGETSNEFLITDTRNYAGVDRNGVAQFHGPYGTGLIGNIVGSSGPDTLKMRFSSTDAATDVIRFDAGTGAAPDTFEAKEGDFRWIEYSTSAGSNGTLKFQMLDTARRSDFELLSVEQVKVLAGSNERLTIRVSGVISDLVVEDADTLSEGRMKIRSLSGAISPIEFSNPSASIVFVFDAPGSTATVLSQDPAFVGTITNVVGGVSLSNDTISEEAPAGTAVGTLSTQDPALIDGLTLSLVAGSGDTDNSRFVIEGTTLKTTAVLDFEFRSSYSIRVRAVGADGIVIEKIFTINVTDVFEDVTAPVTLITALPAASNSRNLNITVTGNDPGAGATGVKEYDLYVSTGGAFTKFATVPAASPSTTFTGNANTNYWFRSLGRDNAGNVETKTTSDTYTRIGDVVPPSSQVLSATSTAAGLITLNMSGTKINGSVLTAFDVYVTIDGGGPMLVGTANAAPAGGSNYTGQILYQGLTDGVAHTYSFYSRARDGAGNVESAPAAGDVTQTWMFASAPLTATGIDVQNGVSQRSYVRYLDVLFSTDSGVNNLLSSGRVKVERFGIDATSVVPGSGTVIAGAGLTQSGNRLRLDFGATGLGGLRQAGNGFYRILLDMDGNGSFADAGDSAFEFHRLFGDATGDGKVDVADTARVNSQFGRTGANLDGDVDGNGAVTSTDRLYVTQQLGKKLLDPLLSWLDD